MDECSSVCGSDTYPLLDDEINTFLEEDRRDSSVNPPCNHGYQTVGMARQRHSSMPIECLVENEQLFQHEHQCKFSPSPLKGLPQSNSTDRLAKKPRGAAGKCNNSMSYMSRLSSSFLSIASSVTDGYKSATGRRKTSLLPGLSAPLNSMPASDCAPTFEIPKWSAPPRDERLTSKAELMNFLKNSNPKGYLAAIVYDMDEEKLNSDEELYRKKIREEIAPIDFVEVSGLGQSEGFCSIFEF